MCKFNINDNRILSQDWSHSPLEVPCQRFLVHCVCRFKLKHSEGDNGAVAALYIPQGARVIDNVVMTNDHI